MGRRRNKLYKKRCRPYIFSRHECRIFKIAHTCSRARSENQFSYAKVQFILVPPQFRPVTANFVRSGNGTDRASLQKLRRTVPYLRTVLSFLRTLRQARSVQAYRTF